LPCHDRTDNGAWLFCDPNSQRSLPAALTALRAQNLTVDALQLDGWWMNKTVFKPNDQFFPDWPAFRKAIGAETKLLLYKAFFSGDDVLLNKFRKVQSTKGPWYPAAADAEPFFLELFAEGQSTAGPSYSYEPVVILQRTFVDKARRCTAMDWNFILAYCFAIL